MRALTNNLSVQNQYKFTEGSSRICLFLQFFNLRLFVCDWSNLLRNTILLKSLKSSKKAEWLNAAHRWGEGELAPYSAEWDKNSHFPIDVIKASAEQGFMGLYTDPEYGGMGLSRLETSIIFEALSQHCVSTTAFMSIHNMG